MKPAAFIILISIMLIGCKKIEKVFDRKTPYEEYVQSLEKAELINTHMAKQWLEAGAYVFQDSIMIDLPHSEVGFFSAGSPQANGYLFNVKAGQVLTIDIDIKTHPGGKVFFDLFRFSNNKWEHVAAADTSRIVEEFEKDNLCLVRIQPELLIDVHFTVEIGVDPALINPVSNATNRSIGSIFGDPRDGGNRTHEGIDIFAPRGTPVIAPADGRITRVGLSRLGGKTVWMRDKKRKYSYYFAHLDSQLVVAGTAVTAGDTIGLVGNTGNAITTPPHLHFGIYSSGSIDPFNFVRTTEAPENVKIDTSFKIMQRKITAKIANMRAAPSVKSNIIDELERNSYIEILGKAGSWYRIGLPSKRQGFISESLVGEMNTLHKTSIEQQTILLSMPSIGAVPKKTLKNGTEINVLAHFSDFLYVKTQDGITGWMQNIQN